jgi:hypothetical protein
MIQLASTAPAVRRPLDRLVVKSGGTTRFVKVTEIDCIEAAGVYVNLHVAGKELLYRSTLQELIERLDPLRFVRVEAGLAPAGDQAGVLPTLTTLFALGRREQLLTGHAGLGLAEKLIE